MAKVTKKQLLKENEALKGEIELLKQQIRTLEAKLSFYQTVEKSIGDACNGAGAFISSYVGWNLGNSQGQEQK